MRDIFTLVLHAIVTIIRLGQSRSCFGGMRSIGNTPVKDGARSGIFRYKRKRQRAPNARRGKSTLGNAGNSEREHENQNNLPVLVTSANP
jgi:hypothetical protein